MFSTNDSPVSIVVGVTSSSSSSKLVARQLTSTSWIATRDKTARMPTLKGLSSQMKATGGKSKFLPSAIANKIKNNLPHHHQSNNKNSSDSSIGSDRDFSERSDSSAISDHNDAAAAAGADHLPRMAYSESGRTPLSLEATMSLKYSKATGNKTKWFEAYVVLDMTNNGSMKCYPRKPNSRNKFGATDAAAAAKRQSTRIGATSLMVEEDIEPLLEIPARLNWLAKDFEHSSTRFVIEIPTEGAIVRQSFLSTTTNHSAAMSLHTASTDMMTLESLDESYTLDDPGDSGLGVSFTEEEEDEDFEDFAHQDAPASLLEAINSSRRKGEPFRLHVQCIRRGGNEKQVWIKAFEELGRLSFDLHKRLFGITRKFKDPKMKLKHERIRTDRDDRFAKQTQILSSHSELPNESDEDDDESTIQEMRLFGPHKSDFRLSRKSDNREFLVYPSYAYRNKWMTDSELYTEMLQPSQVFHDTRLSSEAKKEIGTVRVEVLECSGLPSLDWNSETDAVVYLVCGSYAFTTDVIMNKLNPVWLPRARRACILPIFHAYAKIYVGVFDDDGKGQNDDFAGRVVVDLAKCRPGTTYDIALPLRLSSHIYSRRSRGMIRLRFSIDYPDEKAALLSYLPSRRKKKSSFSNSDDKDDDVTLLCHDEKAFRNTILTVHGVDIPGRFTTPLLKATTKEIDFLRKVATNAIANQVFDIIFWKNRSVSALCLLAWMHCVYANSFALVPFYMVCFLLLLMLQNYVFYGSDGRIHQGFIPPSFEEMFAALFKLPGKKYKSIQPLYVKPHKDERSALVPGKTYKTHQQQGKTLFRLLGLSAETADDQPEDYHMEFPLSRGLRHPITDEYQYPRLTAEECRVKKKDAHKSKEDTDGSYSEFMTVMSNGKTEEASSTNLSQFPTRLGLTSESLPNMIRDKAEKKPVCELKAKLKISLKKKCHNKSDADREMEDAFRSLPSRMRIPNQDIDAKKVSDGKKKIAEELGQFRTKIHNATKNMFHDKTYIMGQEDAIFFGGKQSKHVASDLDKLLGAGQYASSNPVTSMIGVHLEPMVDAAHAVLGMLRAVVNICTWQDPILSFWVTMGLIAGAFVTLIFPFRLFFFAIGLVVLGPQNWAFITYIRPNFLEELKEKKEIKKQAKLAKRKEKKFRGIPKNQPIVTAHTSDSSPPLSLSLDDVDKRGIHQVCVPYSQLTYRRDNYWPPEPEYGKCEPNTLGFQKSTERLKVLDNHKGSIIGIPSKRSS